jgi:dephospho-CoA kinase
MPQRILRVGLTGGIASGKSTVAARLSQHGIPVLDADEVVHSLYRPGGDGAREVAREFGPEVLNGAGGVDRARLARRVFGDAPALARLNARIHPMVIDRQKAWFEEREAAGELLGVVEATLLVESGGRDRYDVVVAVSAPPEVRLERAVRRSGESERANLQRRIEAQLKDEEREKAADIVLTANGSKEDLLAKVDELAVRLKTMAAERLSR